MKISAKHIQFLEHCTNPATHRDTLSPEDEDIFDLCQAMRLCVASMEKSIGCGCNNVDCVRNRMDMKYALKQIGWIE